MKKLVILLISLLFSSIIFAQGVKVGDYIPEFKYYTLDKKEISSKELEGRKILLNFTATWCPFCIDEKNRLEREYPELQNKNNNMAILILFGPYGKKADRKDSEASVSVYMSNGKLSFPVYFDKDGEVISKFGIDSVPTTFLIDEKGKVIEVSEEYYKLEKLNR